MNQLVNAIWAQYLKLHRYKINRFSEQPHESQEEELMSILDTAKYTEWGQKYHFADVLTANDWRQRLPVQDYESIKTDIFRMMKGEFDVLWPGRVSYFSKSSGTTNDKSKYIPVTEENHKDCHVRGGWRQLALMYENIPDPRIIEGKSIIMAGSSTNNLSEFPGSTIGDVSAIVLQRIPYVGKLHLSPDLDIALMSDFETKLEKIAEICIHEDIRMMAGVPTWAMVVFDKILEKTGKSNILEVWPRMQIFIHGAVSFGPYREPFKKYFPSDEFYYQETYNASEGYFAVQSDFASDDMLLLLDNGVYYEFIPMEEWESEFPNTLLLSEVEVGKNYAIVITTNSGLYRYKIGDTVTFTSLAPYKIKITGRTKQFINVFGEEVMVANTDAALIKTCEMYDAKMKEYTVAPIFLNANGKGGHEWIIEFEKQPSDVNLFAATLDENLRKINSDYDAKRYHDLALVSLKLNVAPEGTFMKWMKSKNKIGAQQKVPRLSNQRTNLEEILQLINN
ncbi:MAG: GH3 auxin-responsive promoter family protein [Saprospiraceae bacterium]